jgi:UDP-N-acetyl-D-mannosaminuronic acid dehydrogenase
MSNKKQKYDVAVVGGAGHVGAPMAIVLASKGFNTLVYDLNRAAMDTLARGEMPFIDEGAEPLLRDVLAAKKLGFSSDITDLRGIPTLVVTIGTPIDEFHNPDLRSIMSFADALRPHLADGQLLILRSTVFPGVRDYLHRYLSESGTNVLLAFCPERVVQGKAVEEIQALPQLVSGATPEAFDAAVKFFGNITPSIVPMQPMEAEFAKLFCNAYRYIQFAASNQFYMMADSAGLNYARILNGLKEGYPRMRDLPGSGFTAGPCLFKDTLQLAALSNNQFSLGHAAIQVNEGLPRYIVSRLRERNDLRSMTVGLLGMAFKANSDDTRASLSYRIKKLLRQEAKEVLTNDPFVTTDPELLPIDEVISRSDLLIVCAPHSSYKKLNTKGKSIVDIWDFVDTSATS